MAHQATWKCWRLEKNENYDELIDAFATSYLVYIHGILPLAKNNLDILDLYSVFEITKKSGPCIVYNLHKPDDHYWKFLRNEKIEEQLKFYKADKNPVLEHFEPLRHPEKLYNYDECQIYYYAATFSIRNDTKDNKIGFKSSYDLFYCYKHMQYESKQFNKETNEFIRNTPLTESQFFQLRIDRNTTSYNRFWPYIIVSYYIIRPENQPEINDKKTEGDFEILTVLDIAIASDLLLSCCSRYPAIIRYCNFF